MHILINSLIVLTTILLLSFLQKYHFKMLFYIKNRSPKIIGVIISFFIRLGVIIHELLHLIFGLIGGSKVSKIELFSKTGGRVVFETKNYIGSIGNNYDKRGFFIYLFFNQIGIFLTSMGPLIGGIIFNYIFINYLFGFHIDFTNLSYSTNFMYSETATFFLFTLYFLLLPSFILSFQDISNFIISKQENKLATFGGSIINTFIFICFILFATLFMDSLLYFLLFYSFVFLGIFVVFVVVYILKKIKK